MTRSWLVDLDEVRDMLEDLDEAGLLARARAAAAEWRPVESFSSFFLPLPLVAQDVPSLRGAWLPLSSAEPGRHDAVGLDSSRRPVAHLLDRAGAFEQANYLWFWDDDGSFLEVELLGSGPHVRRALVIDGQIVYVVTASAGDREAVREIEWRDGLAVAAGEAYRWQRGHGVDRVVSARVRDGQVEQLWAGSHRVDGSLSDGLRHAAGTEPDRLVWDGRTQRP